MVLHDRYTARHCGPVAERMAFSSYGRGVDDIWAHDLERHYQIVLMPGYEIPDGLDRGDRDAMWLREGRVETPLVAWDGFCPIVLHEIILECFDYDGASSFIKVVDRYTRKFVPDPRPREFLNVRPRRPSGLGKNGIENHLAELYIWSLMLPGDDPTSKLYSDLIFDHNGSSTGRVDTFKRYEAFHARGMPSKDLYAVQNQILASERAGNVRAHESPCLGPIEDEDTSRTRRDAKVALLDTRLPAMSKMPRLTLSDLPDPTSPPESFYRLAVKKGGLELDERRSRLSRGIGGLKARFLSGDGNEKTNRNPF